MRKPDLFCDLNRIGIIGIDLPKNGGFWLGRGDVVYDLGGGGGGGGRD